MKRCRFLIWLLPLAAAVMIFWFSSQTGDESASLSDGLLLRILNFFAGRFQALDVDSLLDGLSNLIRKAAHVAEFAVLYGTLLLAWFVSGIRKYRWVLFSILTVFLYACSDEIHQIFVDGRASQFKDVLIDCAVPAGISVIFILHFLWTERKGGEKDLSVNG